MTRQRFFAIARVVFVAVVAICGVAVTRAAAVDMAAAAAAKASPELAAALAKEVGGTPEQAAGAAGAMFGLAKSRLKPADFSKVAAAVPGMDLLLKAAPAAAAAGGGADALSQLAGTVGGIPQIAGAFSKLGLKPEMVPAAASVLASFVTKKGGAGLGSLLAGVLK